MTFIIETLGCKVNQYESAAIAELLHANGHTEADGANCDVIIVNTCAVTGEASRKSRQAARRLKSLHPNATLAVCGCAGGTERTWEDAGAVLVAGSRDRRGFVQRLDALLRSSEVAVVAETDAAFEILPAATDTRRTRASIKIQDGCDDFCAYCVIPYARGRVRSMPPETVAAQAKELGARGYREIVVTGIEISAYGRDLGGNATLTSAIRTVADNAPDARIRLSSLEPSTVTREFVRELSQIPNVCSHFHMSLQSGCDATLKRMRRKYETDEFLGAVTMLRDAFPNCGITADIIAGFPGETDTEFENTLRFIEKCAFSGAHVFPYSVRPGTVAAKMPDKIANAVKRERAKRVREITARTKDAFLRAQVGRTLNVLFETEEDGVFIGHTENYCDAIASGADLRGQLRTVRAVSAENGRLSVEITP